MTLHYSNVCIMQKNEKHNPHKNMYTKNNHSNVTDNNKKVEKKKT